MEDKKVDLFDLDAGVPNVDGPLRPRPKFSDRISKRVIVVAFGFLALVLILFLVGLSQVGEKRKPSAKEEIKLNSDKTDKGTGSPTPVELAGGKEDEQSKDGLPSDKPRTAGSLLGGNNIAPLPVVDAKASPDAKTGVVGVVPPITGAIPKISDTTIDAPAAVKTPQQIAFEQAKQERMGRMIQARSNGLSAKGFNGDGAVVAPTSADALRSTLLEAAKNNQPQQGLMDAAQGQVPPQPVGGQDEKLKFLKDLKKEDHGYHPNVPMAAISPNEVKIGSYIPLIPETGTNSDLPGQITARSSEAVYDTVTGCHELIPAMTKFVGRYDSKVDLGQGRMLYAWNSAVFKDGSELNLAGMQGYDSSGQSGLGADVDNHYLRMFGYAFGMSMVTAGIQLSVPTPATSANGVVAAPSVAQTVATALSQQYGQLGAQLMGKSLNIQPTLRNYPGERFMIMVPNTIVMTKVWSNRCQGSGVSFK